MRGVAQASCEPGRVAPRLPPTRGSGSPSIPPPFGASSHGPGSSVPPVPGDALRCLTLPIRDVVGLHPLQGPLPAQRRDCVPQRLPAQRRDGVPQRLLRTGRLPPKGSPGAFGSHPQFRASAVA